MVRTARLGMLIAVSSAVYVVESAVPYPVPVGRWGISNFVVLFTAVNWGLRSTIVVASAKSILGAVMTGRFLTPTFFMGFTGSVVAGFVEWLFSKMGFGYMGLSIMGSVANNVVQVTVGSLLIKSLGIFSLLPIFLVFGGVSAVANAYLAKGFERFWRGER